MIVSKLLSGCACFGEIKVCPCEKLPSHQSSHDVLNISHYSNKLRAVMPIICKAVIAKLTISNTAWTLVNPKLLSSGIHLYLDFIISLYCSLPWCPQE